MSGGKFGPEEGRKRAGVAEEFLQVLMVLVWELDLVEKRALNLCLSCDFLMLNSTVNSTVASF